MRTWKYTITAAWVLIVGAIMALAGTVNDVQSDDIRNWLPATAESTRALDLAEAQFPSNDPETLLIVYARDGGLTETDRTAVKADAAALGIQAPPVFSEDGKAALLAMPFTSTLDAVRSAVEADRPEGLVARLTGGPAAEADFEQAFDSLDSTLLIVTVGVVALLLLLTYRSPVLLFIPLICAGVASTTANGLVYWAAKNTGLVVDPQSAGILTVLVFGAGTDYAMLLIARYREELRLHADRHTAMGKALRRSLPAILASSATVVLALMTLIFADLNSTRGLGPVASLGIISALAVMTTLLPALLVLCGRWAFWPAIPHLTPTPDTRSLAAPDTRSLAAPDTRSLAANADAGTGTANASAANAGGANAGGEGGKGRREGVWERLAALVARRPKVVWVTTTAVLLLAALGALTLKTGLKDADSFTTKPDSVVGFELLAKHFPAGSTEPVDVFVPAGNAGAATEVITKVTGVDHVEKADERGGWARIPVIVSDDPGGKEAEQTVARLREAARTVDAEAMVGGSIAQRLDQSSTMDSDLLLVIPLILLVVLLVLIALLRAIVAPVLLLASVVLSFAAALGISAGIYRLLGFPAIDKTVLLNGFLFLVALGVDYTIFLMTRAREETANIGHRKGMTRALAVTGGVITSAGLVLAATFGVLAVLPIVFMVQLGILVAVGVLLDTFVVRSLLVPALILSTGPRSWWPGRLASQRGFERSGDAAPGIVQRLGAHR